MSYSENFIINTAELIVILKSDIATCICIQISCHNETLIVISPQVIVIPKIAFVT